ncbi:MAG: hypothetical protein WC273_04450 [Dehalococcoidia bacterium]
MSGRTDAEVTRTILRAAATVPGPAPSAIEAARRKLTQAVRSGQPEEAVAAD